MSVKFQYGTQADYDSLENFDSTCIYFITDTQRVYRGDTLYASGIQDKLTAGENITIDENNVISLADDFIAEVEKKADKTYVDGELAKKQNNLTAGAGISINEDNVISASAHFQVEVVTLNEQGLPSVNEPSSQVLYLTHNTQTEVSDVYNEWLWIYDTEIESFRWEKIGSTQVDLSGYAQKSELPTKTSELQNDSNFVSDANYVHTDNNFTNEEKTKLENDVATKSYVEQKIATFDFIKIVEALPEQGLPNRTYFVLKTDQQTNDLYDEYMWVNNKWEFVGTRQIEVDLTNYVKNTDYATSTKAGVIKASVDGGIYIDPSTGVMQVAGASLPVYKAGASNSIPVTPIIQHVATFYGLAKASGDTTQSNSSNAVGEYTDEAKTKIQNMLGVQPKFELGDGLQLVDGVLSLDIPVATASTTYGGGDAQ